MSIDRSLAYSCDVRPLAVFKPKIKDDTARERRLAHLWGRMLVDLGFYEQVDILPHGCDNSGEFIADRSQVTTQADHRVRLYGSDGRLLSDGVYLVESKYDPVDFKATYKANDLRSYADQQAYVLTVFCRWKTEIPTGWSLMGPRSLGRVIAETPCEPRKEYGWKPGYQLWKADGQFREYFDHWYTWQGRRLPM